MGGMEGKTKSMEQLLGKEQSSEELTSLERQFEGGCSHDY